jgi:DNA-binding transcriptional LysR family regulator
MTARPKLVSIALDTSSRPPRQAHAALAPGDMVTFAAIAKARGVRAGADALRVPRSTVSRRLAALERALGGRLVMRSTRSFALTELGAALHSKCVELEELLRATELITEAAAREPTGALSVTASPVIGEEFLPEVIAAYMQRFPKVRLTVELTNRFVDLGSGAADLAIRTGPLAERSELFAVRLGASHKGHYASPRYLEGRGVPSSPAELGSHDCILVGEGLPPMVWAFRWQGAERHVSVQGRLRVNNHRLALAAAVAGLGIARLPAVFARPAVEAGALVPVLEKHAPRTELFAVHIAGHPAPPKIRAFIDLLRTTMKPRLAQG